jgi:hypothetical protein
MNIFKKCVENIKRDWNISEVFYYAKIYDEVEIENKKPIKINDKVYVVRYSDDLIFFVKEANWKKYIGVKRIYLEDSQYDIYYKSSDLKNIKNCRDIPIEMIEIMYDELIKYKNDINSALQVIKNEEFYL